jgi:hypothetical protein
MIKRSFIVAAVLVGFAAPALAGHCPVDVKKLEAAMPNLKGAELALAKEAAAKGAELHAAGKHGESLKVMHAALKKLGLDH